MSRNKHLRVCFVGPMLGRHPGWVPNPSERMATLLTVRGLECSLVSTQLNRYRRLVDILTTIWKRRNQVDVLSLQVYGGPSFVVEDAASLLGAWLGLPIVMTLRGGGFPDFMRRYRHWVPRVLKRAHAIIAPSSFLAESVKPFGFNVKVIPNGIDVQNYLFHIRNVCRLQMLWMRTFHEIYNPEMAVETLAQLIGDYPNITLTMAGQEKGLSQVVKRLVQEKHLESCVRFTGFLDTAGKQREFAKHDIFLNTNRVDNMPVSIVEASAFGMPIVATSVGGVPYLIRDGENGLLVPNEDVNAMAQAVRRLIDEAGLAERLSKNARVFAETHDWSIVLPMWESLFREVTEL